ncbi:MAG: hypothetical protein Q8O42_09680 [Acidobacteriota bacterium]|nr:hypothetical protein [Acidobacteriota bacterium]
MAAVVNARLVRGFTQGRQFGVDAERYGSWYVFSRGDERWLWQIHAGPFDDESAAVAFIDAIQPSSGGAVAGLGDSRT